MSIGQLIPYIQKNVQPSLEHKKNCQEILERYQHMKKRYQELVNNDDQTRAIINSIPRHSCLSQEPFLQDNTDFFIAFTLMSDKNEINMNSCGEFIRHINNCYWCFSEYNQFIKDVYYATKEFEN